MSSRFLISFSRIFHFGARLFVFVFFYPEVGRWSILVFILFLLFTRCRFYLLIVLGAPSHPTELADDLPLPPTLVINCLRQITRCWASIRGRIALLDACDTGEGCWLRKNWSATSAFLGGRYDIAAVRGRCRRRRRHTVKSHQLVWRRASTTPNPSLCWWQ